MNHLRRPLLLPIAAMAIIVTVSNFAVQFPIKAFGLGDYLTWGAFTYPFSFFVNELTNRRYGPAAARQVVYVGFVVAIVLSALIATPRIAVASGTAFLIAQLLDVFVFDWLRRQTWWRAPFLSAAGGSAVDTAVFFSLAFVGTPVPWVSLAITDFFVKLGFAAALVAPFGYLRRLVPAYEEVKSRA
jgi:uncharacterized PurR-regulated membrane protein YhhQ (DUF165 family)